MPILSLIYFFFYRGKAVFAEKRDESTEGSRESSEGRALKLQGGQETAVDELVT